jgi:methionyl aminopeptidase
VLRKMINIKSPKELEIMKEGGQITSEALQEVLKLIAPGITTLELDKAAEEYIVNKGATPSFKTVEGYNYTTCININEGIVHGVPNNYKLKTGDVVSIDLGSYYRDFHTDLSYTVEVGTSVEKKFLGVGKKALDKAIEQCRVGNHVGDISFIIQTEIEVAGYSVSRDLVGHGVGMELHEDPHIPCYGKENSGSRLKEGMVLAIEVIYQKGNPELLLSEDDWTLKTADGSLSGLFENTIGITQEGPMQITHFD